MKNHILKIVLSFVVLLIINSCTDISSVDNTTKLNPIDVLPMAKSLEYHFAADGKSFFNNDTSYLWTALKPGTWGKEFYIINRTKDSILEITNVSLLNGKQFSLILPNLIPVELTPNQENYKNAFSILLNTQNLEKGIYTDKIIINNNQNTGFYIKINVK